jgi:hypothetical protein
VRAPRSPRSSRAGGSREDRGNARVARPAVRAWRRGASPIQLAMGSWERSHWGSLPPWETLFKVFIWYVVINVRGHFACGWA